MSHLESHTHTNHISHTIYSVYTNPALWRCMSLYESGMAIARYV